ncbi:alkaline phosphatase family protein [Candidatus Marsarchaeota archaeon]|nr:alkaline phosphatase family protein [Candidatus Marsarchaeota archaeon]MCL5404377.1 alkaline phosphatase family protein [Candidatus Marsarchaeota archaeon]
MPKKLYLVGIDAAPLWILKENLSKYKLSGFGEFFRKGLLMDMESTLPPMTGPSWPSIYTGFRPGDHGVPEFLRMEPSYTKSVAYYDPTIKKPFWEALAENGHKCLVITPAMLVRPTANENIDMITGFPLPSKFSSKRIQKVAAAFKFSGEPDIEADMKSGKISLAEASKIFQESIVKRADVAKAMMNEKDYDFVFVCFTEQDRLQHFTLNLKDWRDYVMPLYERISEFLLWLEHRLESGNGTIMMVSDHGAQPIKKKFLMNGWLIKEGYARLKPELEAALQNTTALSTMKYSLREKVLKRVNRSGSRKLIYDKLPIKLKNLSKNTFSKLLEGVSQDDYVRIHDFDYDMRRTKAFASIANTIVCTIYINDSRFSHGIVSKTEKKKLKRELMEKIAAIKDSDGSKLIVKVFDADDYYEGTKLFIAPDIMAEIKRGYLIDVFGYQKSGRLFMAPEMAKRGDHMRNGILGLLSTSEPIDYKDISKSKVYVYNVAPTILKYFDCAAETDARYKPIF